MQTGVMCYGNGINIRYEVEIPSIHINSDVAVTTEDNEKICGTLTHIGISCINVMIKNSGRITKVIKYENIKEISLN